MPYDAFLSYSQAADGRLAPSIQSALHRFAKRWYRRRALYVFRDATSLSATPSLWPSIEQALADSRFFILLASPEAAQSPWVQKEVAYWRENKNIDNLLVVLTGGSLVWDTATNDFDWERSDALPPTLRGGFTAEPLYVDLSWAREREHLSLQDARFRGDITLEFPAFSRHFCSLQ